MASNAVHFPAELVDLIDRAMELKGGYSSRAEFVRECARLRSHAIIDADLKRKEKAKRKIGRWP